MSAIEMRGVAKRFGTTAVLSDVDLEVPAESTTAVVGASGSGKTTLLRLIAGFERADAGTIVIGGRTVDDGRNSVRSQHRGVGYVPQDGALFPHLTALGNVGFGLRRSDREAARGLLDLVGLAGLERRYPHQLSGGQQQRVALARALAIRPAVVLLDEPFSSLDASLRIELREDVARILAETRTTTILVTHDRDEALTLADQVAILGEGRVLTAGEPRSLYLDPPDLVAAAAIGEANVLAAEVRGDRAVCALGAVPLRVDGRPPVDGPSRLLLRPEQLLPHPHPGPGLAGATVVGHRYHGHDGLVRLQLDGPAGETVLARVSADLIFDVGQEVWVEVAGGALAWPTEEHR